MATSKITQGPSMNTGRFDHGCARLNDEFIIVAGQSVMTTDNLFTEVLKIGELEWTYGPNLTEAIGYNELVKSNRKEYIAYNLGGSTVDFEPSSKIYGLNSDTNEWELIGNMNEPRSHGSALNVPSHLIPWCDDG